MCNLRFRSKWIKRGETDGGAETVRNKKKRKALFLEATKCFKITKCLNKGACQSLKNTRKKSQIIKY